MEISEHFVLGGCVETKNIKLSLPSHFGTPTFFACCAISCYFFLLFVAYVVKKSYLCPVPHAGVSCPHRVREEDRETFT